MAILVSNEVLRGLVVVMFGIWVFWLIPRSLQHDPWASRFTIPSKEYRELHRRPPQPFTWHPQHAAKVHTTAGGKECLDYDELRARLARYRGSGRGLRFNECRHCLLEQLAHFEVSSKLLMNGIY
jgi:hypothetical protein